MSFVLRKGDDPALFLNDSAKYGPLSEAYIYQSREQADSEVYPGDEVVEVCLSLKPAMPEPQPDNVPGPKSLTPQERAAWDSMPDNLGPLVKLALLRAGQFCLRTNLPQSPAEWAMFHMHNMALVLFCQILLEERL